MRTGNTIEGGKRERFEAWLDGPDLMHARAAMRAAGIRKKSDFVRLRLTQPPGSDHASETGALCLAVNDTLLTLQEIDHPQDLVQRLDDIRDLLQLLILVRLPEHAHTEG